MKFSKTNSQDLNQDFHLTSFSFPTTYFPHSTFLNIIIHLINILLLLNNTHNYYIILNTKHIVLKFYNKLILYMKPLFGNFLKTISNIHLFPQEVSFSQNTVIETRQGHRVLTNNLLRLLGHKHKTWSMRMDGNWKITTYFNRTFVGARASN